MARRYCRAHGIRFTTSFHTRFPEYLNQRFAIPTGWTTAVLRRFHNAGAGLMVATPSLGARAGEPRLRARAAVDARRRHRRCSARAPCACSARRRCSSTSAASRRRRASQAFLDLDLPGRKVVVGGGPQLDELKAQYPDVLFTGKRTGEALAECYASADVFVFPSRTDTFGMVLLEAMASGLPVAALPVCGPQDVVTQRRDRRAVARPARGGARRAVARSRARTRQGGGISAGRTPRGCSSPTSPVPASTARRGRMPRASCR